MPDKYPIIYLDKTADQLTLIRLIWTPTRTYMGAITMEDCVREWRMGACSGKNAGYPCFYAPQDGGINASLYSFEDYRRGTHGMDAYAKMNSINHFAEYLRRIETCA